MVSSGTTGLARFRSVSAHNTKHASVNRIIDYVNGGETTGEKRERELRVSEREKFKERFRRKGR